MILVSESGRWLARQKKSGKLKEIKRTNEMEIS